MNLGVISIICRHAFPLLRPIDLQSMRNTCSAFRSALQHDVLVTLLQ